MSTTPIFQDGTTYTKSKLDMINQCLLSIGEAPYPEGTLTDSFQLGTDAETAGRVVATTMVEVQARGWHFNTDYNFEVYVDENSFITMPPNTLRVDSGITEGNRYILRNGRMYDMATQTFIIDKKYLTLDVVWLKDYEYLPPEAYEYISLRAARKFQQKVIGSSDIAQFTMLDEADALNNLTRAQLQTNDYNIQNSKVSTRIHNGYLISSLYGNVGRRKY